MGTVQAVEVGPQFCIPLVALLSRKGLKLIKAQGCSDLLCGIVLDERQRDLGPQAAEHLQCGWIVAQQYGPQSIRGPHDVACQIGTPSYFGPDLTGEQRIRGPRL